VKSDIYDYLVERWREALCGDVSENILPRPNTVSGERRKLPQRGQESAYVPLSVSRSVLLHVAFL